MDPTAAERDSPAVVKQQETTRLLQACRKMHSHLQGLTGGASRVKHVGRFPLKFGTLSSSYNKCGRVAAAGACRESPDCVVVPGNTKAGTADLCMSRHVQVRTHKSVRQAFVHVCFIVVYACMRVCCVQNLTLLTAAASLAPPAQDNTQQCEAQAVQGGSVH